MASVVVAFAALVLMPFHSLPASLLPKLLFAGIPLAIMAVVAGRHWIALFRPVRLRELGIILLTAISAMLASAAAALVVNAFTSTVANPLITNVTAMSISDYLWMLVPTAPQLLGEELLTLLPFLAVLWFATQRLGMRRNVAIWAALTGSTALFAAAHLPTYDWQVAQCFGVIGRLHLDPQSVGAGWRSHSDRLDRVYLRLRRRPPPGWNRVKESGGYCLATAATIIQSVRTR